MKKFVEKHTKLKEQIAKIEEMAKTAAQQRFKTIDEPDPHPITSKDIADALGLKNRAAAIRIAKQSTLLHESRGYGGERVYSHPLYHKIGGERTLEQARKYDEQGHKDLADQRRAMAEKEAKLAGSEWDESKHPRDENGKFT